VAWTERAPRYASSLDLSPDGAKLAVGGELVRIYEVAHPERHAEFRSFDNNVHRVRFTPAGDALAASAYDGRIRILDVSTAEPELRLRKLLHHGGTANVYALDFSRDGAWLVSSSGDQTLRFWGE
jgi:WD40 repeat protein